MGVLGEVPIVLRRHPGGQAIGADGRPVQPALTVINAAGSVQPLKMREWNQLGLGGRVSDYVKLYTETALQVGDEVTGRLGDRFDWQGNTFEVFGVNEYEAILPHFKGTARRVDESAAGGAP